MSDPQQQTLNLPSLVFVVILVGLSIRYFFFSPSSSTDTRSSNRGRGADPAHVDQILQMFPQLNRRDIQWDLQRNGGSVQATTERVLGGRGLERPPPSFQPVQPPPSSTPTRPAPPPPKSSHPDLITRYNLASRISAASQPEGAAPEEEEASKPQVTWSQSKAERQALLQKRREDMVLAARRKMEQRERERAKGKAKEV
ncbi:MAG: hypothetical protein LQ339_004148 [Xanthoria mediterranea]|nr:MAG: hypothetical protein LQ339_004148 [Xanthoria mediterranea]